MTKPSLHSSLARAAACAAWAAMAAVASASHAAVTFDNISAYQGGTAGASVTSTGSAPNTFIGGAYTLVAGTTSITGLDLYPVNLSGTTYTSLKLNLYFWGTVNTGTVSTATPAFSNLLASTSVTSAGAFTSGFFYAFESAAPGVTPGITLGTPLVVAGGQTIGLTVNVQGSTDGLTYSNVQNLTSLLSYGAAPTVGTMPFNGYYRNGNGEVNGNFTSGVRSLGFTNQGMAVRLYGNVSPVPEAQTWAMMGLGLAALLVVRRRRAG